LTLNHFSPSIISYNVKITDVARPSAKVFIIDSYSESLPVNATTWAAGDTSITRNFKMRHMDSGNSLWLDGHATRRTTDEIRKAGNIQHTWIGL